MSRRRRLAFPRSPCSRGLPSDWRCILVRGEELAVEWFGSRCRRFLLQVSFVRGLIVMIDLSFTSCYDYDISTQVRDVFLGELFAVHCGVG